MKWLLAFAAALTVFILAMLVYVFFVLAPGLPELTAVTDYKPKIPLRIYTADNTLIGEFGEEHRYFVPIAQIPEYKVSAVRLVRTASSSRSADEAHYVCRIRT